MKGISKMCFRVALRFSLFDKRVGVQVPRRSSSKQDSNPYVSRVWAFSVLVRYPTKWHGLCGWCHFGSHNDLLRLMYRFLKEPFRFEKAL
jgi:hypothetical protein